jgi:hypothetical protein
MATLRVEKALGIFILAKRLREYTFSQYLVNEKSLGITTQSREYEELKPVFISFLFLVPFDCRFSTHVTIHDYFTVLRAGRAEQSSE